MPIQVNIYKKLFIRALHLTIVPFFNINDFKLALIRDKKFCLVNNLKYSCVVIIMTLNPNN